MREIIGFAGGDSVFAPGGSICNMYALLVARHKVRMPSLVHWLAHILIASRHSPFASLSLREIGYKRSHRLRELAHLGKRESQ